MSLIFFLIPALPVGISSLVSLALRFRAFDAGGMKKKKWRKRRSKIWQVTLIPTHFINVHADLSPLQLAKAVYLSQCNATHDTPTDRKRRPASTTLTSMSTCDPCTKAAAISVAQPRENSFI